MKTLFDLNEKEFTDLKKVNNLGFVFGKIEDSDESKIENIKFTYMPSPHEKERYIFPKQYNEQILNRYYQGNIGNLIEYRGKTKCCKVAQIGHVILENGEVSIWSCSEDSLM